MSPTYSAKYTVPMTVLHSSQMHIYLIEAHNITVATLKHFACNPEIPFSHPTLLYGSRERHENEAYSKLSIALFQIYPLV